MKRVVLISTFFLIQCVAFAQNDCKELLKQAFLKMKQTTPVAGTGILMDYAVTVHMADGSMHDDNIKVVMFDKKVKVVSEDFTIYQDLKTMVVIQPEANTVFMTRPVDEALRRNQLQDLVNLQDSLFLFMNLKSCAADVNIKNNGSLACRKLVFTLSEQIAKNAGIKSIVYWIDDQNVTVKKVYLEYERDMELQVKSITFEFKNLNYKYSAAAFEGSALAKVIDAKNNLRPEFRGYTLIDKRN